MPERALAEGFRAQAVFFEQSLFHRAGIHADADGDAPLAAGVRHHAHPPGEPMLPGLMRILSKPASTAASASR